MNILLTEADVLALDWQKNPEPLRDRSGLYMVRSKQTGELVYIGQASNLGHRLTPATHPVYRRALHDVYVLFEPDRAERRYMEGRFIEILKPPVNIRAGTRPSLPESLQDDLYRRIFA
jgi:excinuclease UvrABC nuclease subunit